jgi:hypothetical protein
MELMEMQEVNTRKLKQKASEETDRRNDPRKRTSDYFIVIDVQCRSALGRIMNMSRRGMMLISEEPVETHQTFQCELKLPSPVNGRESVSFVARSVWCRHNELFGLYQTGYKIQPIEKADEPTLNKFMKLFLVDEK